MQVRSLKRARDIRDQLVGLMERVEIEMVSDSTNFDGEIPASTHTAWVNHGPNIGQTLVKHWPNIGVTLVVHAASLMFAKPESSAA